MSPRNGHANGNGVWSRLSVILATTGLVGATILAWSRDDIILARIDVLAKDLELVELAAVEQSRRVTQLEAKDIEIETQFDREGRVRYLNDEAIRDALHMRQMPWMGTGTGTLEER